MAKAASTKTKGSSALEEATQLQIFLDRANFSPGPLDGRYGEFTLKALNLYRMSRGEPPAAAPKKDGAPDLTGLDLSSITPVFIPYQVTDADLHNVGPVPGPAKERAKMKALPYASAAEAIAERFHCSTKFLEQLNPGKTKAIKAGDQLKVPNIEPFDVATVKQIKIGSEIDSTSAANELGDEEKSSPGNTAPTSAPEQKTADTPTKVSLRVDTKTNELGVFENDKIVASYPVSIGAGETQSPLGDWKVMGIAKMPAFRYDEKMLKHGERSADFYMLPPGPNSPVGVMWIALNKRGIGIHGGKDPDQIGRSGSHGCIRLTNWDVVRLAERIKKGVPVSVGPF